MKLLRKINNFFIHDTDEEAPFSDYVWFYGLLVGLSVTAAMFFFINLAY